MPELGTRFLKLVLTDACGKQLDRSVYWLPPKPDVLHFNETNYYQTNASFCNMTDLQGLPHAEPQLTPSATGAPGTKSVLVRNPSRHVLFSVHLRLLHANGSDVLPVLWSDNYFTLFAGESQLVTANYSLASGGQQLPLTFAASSWNQVMAKKAKTDDRLEDDPAKAALRPLDLTGGNCCAEVAFAHCFGFTPGADSTASIQSAIDCPAAHTIVVKDMGSPWIVAPRGGDNAPNNFTCPSGHGQCPEVRAALNISVQNKLIVFEPGVVLLAKRWSFVRW